MPVTPTALVGTPPRPATWKVRATLAEKAPERPLPERVSSSRVGTRAWYVAPETCGAVRSIVTAAADAGLVGPLLPARSATLFAFRATITVPTLQPVTATVYAAREPAAVPTTQPVAVPVRVKSDAASPVTLSLNVSV